MKQLCTCFLFVLTFYPCIALGEQSSSQSGEIHGTVYQRNLNQPVASAQVRIVETGQRVLTDANGEFQFRNLPLGKYTLATNASGYIAATDVTAAVIPAEIKRVEIYLEPVVVSLDEVEVTADRPLQSPGRQSLGGDGDSARPGHGRATPFVLCNPCPPSEWQTTSAAPCIFAAVPMKTISIILTECLSVTPTISAVLCPPLVPK